MAGIQVPPPPSATWQWNGSCFSTKALNPNRIWESSNVLETLGPNLCIEIAVSIFFANLFYQILKPFNQPRIIADFLAGFILSPFLLGRTDIVKKVLSPVGIFIFETLASMGLMGYVFLSGLEINIDSLIKSRKKATCISVVGIIIPMIMGMGFYFMFLNIYHEPTTSPIIKLQDTKGNTNKAYLFWSLALTLTGFPMLARILSDLKLVYTRLGKDALSAAMISDTYGWILFIILIPFTSDSDNNTAIYSMLSTLAFIFFLVFVLRPLIIKLIDQEIEQDQWDDSQLLLVVMGCFVCSYITDILGTHAIVGAFVYGLILPRGRFTDIVMAKLDNFVSVIAAPFFFFRTGIMIDLKKVGEQHYWPMMAIGVVLLSVPKILSTLIATFFFSMPMRDGARIGLLLNSKGVLSVVILTIAWERKILSVVAFTLMMCAVFLMTIMVPLVISAIYKPRKRDFQCRYSIMEKLRTDVELRILTCVHNIPQACSTVNVLRTYNATRIAPIHVYGVHLVELTGRATTLYASQIDSTTTESLNSNNNNYNNLSQPETTLETITTTFNTLSEANHAVRVETFNVVSPYETVHMDIYSLAEQNRTTLILLPFHKQPNAVGALETTNEVYGNVNQNVLQDAPCSVAIFVDRGLGSFSSAHNTRIMMIFIGGPDDREALAVAWRMAGHLGNQLSMVRIMLAGEAAEVDVLGRGDGESHWLPSSVMMDYEKQQKVLDDEYVDSFRFKAVYNDDSITYCEEEVHSNEEMTLLLHELDKEGCDLYVVGQGSGRNSVVFSKFLEWCDNPELGVIGDMVASNSFGTRASLLVVQQFGSRGVRFAGDGVRYHHAKSDGSILGFNSV